ncbi:MAG: fatty acid desaturase [Alphaproteobacteria bacterium]
MTPHKAEWPTLILLALTYLLWAAGTLLWAHSALLAVVMTGIAIAQHSSLQHEALHGHPTRNAAWNEALVFPALSLFIPYRRFRDTHLQHHYDPNLTDPYDDPESNYRDPKEWAALPVPLKLVWQANNTLAGRMILGPVIGTMRFLWADMASMARGDRVVAGAWAAHGVGVALVAVWLAQRETLPLWAYLLAVWLGFALIKIRTFLEHRAHDAPRARTVVIEDRGPLSILFLNNNFHVVHHMHPQVPWYDLPALYAARRPHYLTRNDGYVYRSYARIFGQYFLRAKDPVPHPLWPVRRSDDQRDP